MSGFSISQVRSSLSCPRYLRALPSAVLLTASMVFSASSQAGVLGVGAGASTGVSVGVGLGIGGNTVVMPGAGVVNSGIGLDAGVRAGANANVTADERAAAIGANGSAGAGAQADGGLDSSGTVNGVGRVVGGVRDTGQAMGSTAVQTGKRVKGAAQANADARLQSELLRAN